MKRHTIAVLGLIGLLLAAVPASAMKLTFPLDSPNIGANATGLGQIASVRGVETFKVRVFADVKEETTFTVLIERHGPSIGGDDGLTAVGKIKMSLGSGILVLDSESHVSPAFPLKGLKRVVVRYKGATILEGKVFDIGPGN